MRGDAEWNSAQVFEKECGVCGAIREVHMHVIDSLALKQIGEVSALRARRPALKDGPYFFSCSSISSCGQRPLAFARFSHTLRIDCGGA